MENQSDKLEALLYLIDVNQRKASKVIGKGQASEQLTEIILERELLKVLTWLYFKEKDSGRH